MNALVGGGLALTVVGGVFAGTGDEKVGLWILGGSAAGLSLLIAWLLGYRSATLEDLRRLQARLGGDDTELSEVQRVKLLDKWEAGAAARPTLFGSTTVSALIGGACTLAAALIALVAVCLSG